MEMNEINFQVESILHDQTECTWIILSHLGSILDLVGSLDENRAVPAISAGA